MGIDEGQKHLDVAIAGQDTPGQVSHDAAALTELYARLAAATPAQTVLEATRGQGAEVAVESSTAGHVVVVVTPCQVRNFARAAGPLAKTEALDAQVLSAVIQPRARPLPDRKTRALRDLVTTRRHPLQSCDLQVLQATVCRRQIQKGRPHRRHSRIAHHSRCHDQSPETLDRGLISHTRKLTSNTVVLRGCFQRSFKRPPSGGA